MEQFSEECVEIDPTFIILIMEKFIFFIRPLHLKTRAYSICMFIANCTLTTQHCANHIHIGTQSCANLHCINRTLATQPYAAQTLSEQPRALQAMPTCMRFLDSLSCKIVGGFKKTH
jgi:hypothetical protein